MHKIRIISVTLIVSLLTFLLVPQAIQAVGESTSIAVDNHVIIWQAPSSTDNNVMMISAKELAESLGGVFSYDKTSMTGTMTYGKNELVFRLDNNIVKHNGKYAEAPAPMKIKNLRIMVPAWFCYERLGTQVYQNAYRNMLMVYKPGSSKLVYKVMAGDSLWIISQVFGTSIASIKQLNGLTSDSIYAGQKLIIKDLVISKNLITAFTSNSATLSSGTSLSVAAVGYLKPWTEVSIEGKIGDWYKVITPKGRGYIHHSVTWIKQDIWDNNSNSQFFNGKIPVDTSNNYITYKSYTVQRGDNVWAISQKMGLPDYELAKVNNFTAQTTLYVGQVIKVPVHHIDVKVTPGAEYGEVLDWFSEGQYVFPMGSVGKLTDMKTGKSFMIKRTLGANHADSETLTTNDTRIMKEVFGGYWSWNRRSFILEYNGRRFAVSVSGMPHAGIDGATFMKSVSNRSGDYGYGPNYDKIAGNGMDGHFDLYFLNGLRHKDNLIDSQHQQSVLEAGGLR